LFSVLVHLDGFRVTASGEFLHEKVAIRLALQERDFTKLMELEKEKLGLGRDRLVFIGVADLAAFWYCAYRSLLSQRETELGYFMNYVLHRLSCAAELGYLARARRAGDRLLVEIRSVEEALEALKESDAVTLEDEERLFRQSCSRKSWELLTLEEAVKDLPGVAVIEADDVWLPVRVMGGALRLPSARWPIALRKSDAFAVSKIPESERERVRPGMHTLGGGLYGVVVPPLCFRIYSAHLDATKRARAPELVSVGDLIAFLRSIDKREGEAPVVAVKGGLRLVGWVELNKVIESIVGALKGKAAQDKLAWLNESVGGLAKRAVELGGEPLLRKARGFLCEWILGLPLPTTFRSVRWGDYILSGIPDGLGLDFVYEFKSTSLPLVMKGIASTQADLYCLLFRREKKVVELLDLHSSSLRASWGVADTRRALDTLDKALAVYGGESEPVPPKAWKCRSCEYRAKCPLARKGLESLA
jgi:hypothetical protein